MKHRSLMSYAQGGPVRKDPPKNFEKRLNDPNAPVLRNPDGTVSTHRMASGEVDGRFLAYPTIVMRGDTLAELGGREAVDYALANREFREFPSEAEARAYAEGGYKKGTLLERPVYRSSSDRTRMEERDMERSYLKRVKDEWDRNLSLQGYAAGGLVAPLAGVGLGIAGDAGGEDVNDFKYAQMGAGLAMVNPLLGGVAAGAGLGADLLMAGKARKDKAGAVKQENKIAWAGVPDPYAGANLPAGERSGSLMAMARGGAVPTGHVIPVENAKKVIKDAREVGVDLDRPAVAGQAGKIPGNGSPTADDKIFHPEGASPIRVSSGELYVPHGLFAKVAGSQGKSTKEYGRENYPRAGEGRGGYVRGGEVSDGGPRIKKSTVSSWVPQTDADWAKYYQELNSPLRAPGQDAGAAAETPLASMTPATSVPPVAAAADPRWSFMGKQGPDAADPRWALSKSGATGQDTGSDEKQGGDSNMFDELSRINDRIAVGQGVLAGGAMLYNLFGKRSKPGAPGLVRQIDPEFDRTALENRLERDRATELATGVNNFRNRQSLGLGLGLSAQSANTRLSNAAVIEDERNKHNRAVADNAQRVETLNTQIQNEHRMREAAAENAHRQQMGNTVTTGLSSLGSIAGQWMGNRMDLLGMEMDGNAVKGYMDYQRPGGGYEGKSTSEYFDEGAEQFSLIRGRSRDRRQANRSSRRASRNSNAGR